MPQFREIAEGRQKQGADEDVVYTLTTTNWGSSPSNVSVAIYAASDLTTDLESSLLTGSASVSGDVITLPSIGSLTSGTNYVVHIQFTSGGSTFEAKAIIEAET